MVILGADACLVDSSHAFQQALLLHFLSWIVMLQRSTYRITGMSQNLYCAMESLFFTMHTSQSPAPCTQTRTILSCHCWLGHLLIWKVGAPFPAECCKEVVPGKQVLQSQQSRMQSLVLSHKGGGNPINTANHSGPVCSKCHGSAAIWECVFTNTCVSLLLMCLEPVFDIQGMPGYILST